MKRSSMNQSRRKRSKTLVEGSATINTQGVMVRVSCFRIDDEARPRLEVRLEAAGQRATVDLPIAELANLSQCARQAAEGFASALRLRLRSDGMLP